MNNYHLTLVLVCGQIVNIANLPFDGSYTELRDYILNVHDVKEIIIYEA